MFNGPCFDTVSSTRRIPTEPSARVKENLVLTDEIEGFIQKKVTPFGTGAKVDCPKKYLGRTVYLVVCRE